MCASRRASRRWQDGAGKAGRDGRSSPHASSPVLVYLFKFTTECRQREWLLDDLVWIVELCPLVEASLTFAYHLSRHFSPAPMFDAVRMPQRFSIGWRPASRGWFPPSTTLPPIAAPSLPPLRQPLSLHVLEQPDGMPAGHKCLVGMAE